MQRDVNNCTYMNEGVVVKVHAGQKYTSDGMSMAVAKELAARAGVPLQYFANRSIPNFMVLYSLKILVYQRHSCCAENPAITE